jgi:hypothetical protein
MTESGGGTARPDGTAGSASAKELKASRRLSGALAVIASFVLLLIAPSLARAVEPIEVTTIGGPVETEPHVLQIYWGGNWNKEELEA